MSPVSGDNSGIGTLSDRLDASLQGSSGWIVSVMRTD
jgi:hypothetical protein